MLSPEQNVCAQLVMENMPEPIKSSPIMLDVADESMRHIMGGDPLESLRIKATRAVLGNVAVGNGESWVKFIKNHHIENFANSFLNLSPEIMISILENCQWQPSEEEKEAKFTFKRHQITLEVDRKTYLNFNHRESFMVPKWAPFLLRTLCSDQIARISVIFDGKPEENQELVNYKQQFFHLNKTTDYSKHLSLKTLSYKYDVYQPVIFFSEHSKRRGGNQVTAKFNRRSCEIKRSVNDIMTTDFS